MYIYPLQLPTCTPPLFANSLSNSLSPPVALIILCNMVLKSSNVIFSFARLHPRSSGRRSFSTVHQSAHHPARPHRTPKGLGLTKKILHPGPIHQPLLLIPQHNNIRRRLPVTKRIAQLRHRIIRIRSHGGVNTRLARQSSLLHVDDGRSPVRAGLVEDGLVEVVVVAEVSVLAAIMDSLLDA